MTEFEKYKLEHKKLSESDPFWLIWKIYSSYPYTEHDDPDKVRKLRAELMLRHAAHHVLNAKHEGRK